MRYSAMHGKTIEKGIADERHVSSKIENSQIDKTMKKVLIVLAEGFEELEAVATIDVMHRGGLEVVRASLGEERTVQAAHGTRIECDCAFPKLRGLPDEFSAIVLPGGSLGMRNLLADESIAKALHDFDYAGKIVAAICAAPIVLGAAGLLEGRKFTCYPGCETEIASGKYDNMSAVVKDGNLITSRGPGTAIAFGLAIVEALVDAAAAHSVAHGMLIA